VLISSVLHRPCDNLCRVFAIEDNPRRLIPWLWHALATPRIVKKHVISIREQHWRWPCLDVWIAPRRCVDERCPERPIEEVVRTGDKDLTSSRDQVVRWLIADEQRPTLFVKGEEQRARRQTRWMSARSNNRASQKRQQQQATARGMLPRSRDAWLRAQH
jgi:hypothetical protein